MAKPILNTPKLSGTDAERFVKLHSQKLSKEYNKILNSCVNTYQKTKK